MLNTVPRHTGIDNHLCLGRGGGDDVARNTACNRLCPAGPKMIAQPEHARMGIYAKQALMASRWLAATAVGDFGAGVTHLVTISCTGFHALAGM